MMFLDIWLSLIDADHVLVFRSQGGKKNALKADETKYLHVNMPCFTNSRSPHYAADHRSNLWSFRTSFSLHVNKLPKRLIIIDVQKISLITVS